MWQLERFGTAANRAVGTVTGTPEFNVASFALLLNFAWEISQAPLYAGMAGLPHAPLLQWLLLPLLTVWFTRRQLASQDTAAL